MNDVNKYLASKQKPIELPLEIPDNLPALKYVSFTNLTDDEKDIIYMYFMETG